jgi:protocatechuate 3,4-dioxygenase beta subunit
VAAGRDAAVVIRLVRQQTTPLIASSQFGQKAASVAGVVINEITGAPLPRAHVSLWSFDNHGIQRNYGAMTNPDGKFSIEGLLEGRYVVQAQHVGFVSPRVGGSSVILRAGDQKRDLQLPLISAGAITGRVLNSHGEPFEDAAVVATGKGGRQGSQTDAQGRFRIGGLLPGIYRLEASPPGTHPVRSPEVGADNIAPTHYIPVNYPGTVEVQLGGEAETAAIHLRRAPMMQVSGRVTGVPQGIDISLSVNSRFGGFSDIAKPDGTFAWWDLDPGEYIIRAWEGIGPLDSGFDGAPARNSALARITVADTNIENIELRIRPPSEISGLVEYETGAAQAHSPERWLRLPALDHNGGDAVTLSPDGHFTLRPLLPGQYKVVCDCGLPAYVKSMWLGSAPIAGDILDLSDGPDRAILRVLLSSRFGAISGTVQGDRTAMAGLKVALVAISPEHYGLPRFADVDVGGQYSFDSVVPAEYKLAVVDESDLLIQGAKGLEQYSPVVETVKVLAGERTIRNPSILKRQRELHRP